MDGIYLNVVFLHPERGNCTTPDVRCLNLRVPLGNPENKSIFKPISRATKGMKLGPKATENHEKLTLESYIRNPISTKVDFCNNFHAKCLFVQSQTLKFRPKNHEKKQPGNRCMNLFVKKCPNN